MSNHRTVNLLALSLSFTALFACLEDEDTEDTSPRGGLLSCPKCQLNAAQVSGHPISYLDLSGAPNEQGISIGLVQDPEGSTYDFGVYEEDLAAFNDGVLVASGEKMIGWTIMLDVAGKTKSIKVKGREMLASWAKNSAPISIYALEDEDETNVCPAYKTGVASLTIIHGETYDAEHAVIDHQGPQWITLACADEAVFKVKRFGYGPNGNQGPGGKPASTAQRTAALKMVIADYCGDGHSFTAAETQVMWRNATWTVSTPDKGQLVMPEAVWTEKGAVCIGRPRYALLSEIAKYCSLPRCSTYMSKTPGPYAWQSLVPLVPFASW